MLALKNECYSIDFNISNQDGIKMGQIQTYFKKKQKEMEKKKIEMVIKDQKRNIEIMTLQDGIPRLDRLPNYIKNNA